MPTVNPPPADDGDLRLDYDPDTRRLTVARGGGEIVVYRRVPRAVYEAFERAGPSKRQFLATHIRPRYPVA